MIEKVRKFIARIVDIRVSEAVIDLHRSMQSLDYNANERQTELLTRLIQSNDNTHNVMVHIEQTLDSNHGEVMKVLGKPVVPPAPGTKKPFIGRELKNEKLKTSKEWAAMPEDSRQYFIALVKNRFNDIELQGCFEYEFFRNYQPVVMMLSHMRIAAADYAEKEVI